MNDNTLKKNLALQTAYQILNIILPLFTAPYLARVLGAEQLGIFSYTSSIVSYFTLFAMLGTVNYGTRCIAAVKENRKLRSITFINIYSLQLFFSVLTFFIYVCYCIFFVSENKVITLIQGIAILSCFFDINWLYWGVENFKPTVIRSFIIRLITVLAIFLLVKEKKDLWLYTLIMLGGTLVGQIILLINLIKIIDFHIPNWIDIKKHIKPNLVFFVPLLAMSVYHSMDKTMLGLLSSYTETGFYYNSDKIVNIPLSILTGIGIVMLPRMVALFESNCEKGKNYFFSSLDGTICLGVALFFGISSISKDFVPFFFGKGYEECISLTKIFSVVIIIKGISNTINTQFLIPMKLEKIFIHSTLAGTIINLIVNLLLIPKYGAIGAVLGTIAAEFFACIWRILYIRISLKQLWINSFMYSIIGLGMYVVVQLISKMSIPIMYKLFLEVVVGGCFYTLLTWFFWTLTKNSFLKIFKR